MEAQDPQWAHAYIKNTRGLEGHAANVLIPQVWMVPKGVGTPLNTPEMPSNVFTSTTECGSLYTHGSVDITELVLRTAGLSLAAHEAEVIHQGREDKGRGGEGPAFSIAVGDIFPTTPPPTYYSPPPFYYQVPAVPVGEGQTMESDLTEMGFSHLALPIEWKMYVPDQDLKRDIE